MKKVKTLLCFFICFFVFENFLLTQKEVFVKDNNQNITNKLHLKQSTKNLLDKNSEPICDNLFAHCYTEFFRDYWFSIYLNNHILNNDGTSHNTEINEGLQKAVSMLKNLNGYKDDDFNFIDELFLARYFRLPPGDYNDSSMGFSNLFNTYYYSLLRNEPTYLTKLIDDFLWYCLPEINRQIRNYGSDPETLKSITDFIKNADFGFKFKLSELNPISGSSIYTKYEKNLYIEGVSSWQDYFLEDIVKIAYEHEYGGKFNEKVITFNLKEGKLFHKNFELLDGIAHEPFFGELNHQKKEFKHWDSFEKLDQAAVKQTQFKDRLYSGVMLKDSIKYYQNYLSNNFETSKPLLTDREKNNLEELFLAYANLFFKVTSDLEFFEVIPIIYFFPYASPRNEEGRFKSQVNESPFSSIYVVLKTTDNYREIYEGYIPRSEKRFKSLFTQLGSALDFHLNYFHKKNEITNESLASFLNENRYDITVDNDFPASLRKWGIGERPELENDLPQKYSGLEIFDPLIVNVKKGSNILQIYRRINKRWNFEMNRIKEMGYVDVKTSFWKEIYLLDLMIYFGINGENINHSKEYLQKIKNNQSIKMKLIYETVEGAVDVMVNFVDTEFEPVVRKVIAYDLKILYTRKPSYKEIYDKLIIKIEDAVLEFDSNLIFKDLILYDMKTEEKIVFNAENVNQSFEYDEHNKIEKTLLLRASLTTSTKDLSLNIESTLTVERDNNIDDGEEGSTVKSEPGTSLWLIGAAIGGGIIGVIIIVGGLIFVLTRRKNED